MATYHVAGRGMGWGKWEVGSEVDSWIHRVMCIEMYRYRCTYVHTGVVNEAYVCILWSETERWVDVCVCR